MKIQARQSLIAAAILALLACMIVMQWEGFGDDDDSADVESDDDSACDDDSAEGTRE